MRTKAFTGSKVILSIALCAALLNGLIYIWLVPPWQHYDEPNHFEYAWWLANYKKLPEEGAYDQEMRREVLRSMVEHNFYRGSGSVPDVNTTAEPISIGQYSQFDEPFLYYAITAVPLFFLQDQTIDIQLYAARIVSLILLLLTIACAYGVVAELTTPQNPLRWMVPISLALLPGFVDLMTAVNNDVGAIAAASFACWLSVRLIHKGIHPLELIAAGLMIIVSMLMKETAYPSALLIILSVILGLSKDKKYRLIVWLGTVLVILMLVVAAFSWGDAAMWYRNTYQGSNTRIEIGESAPLGRAVFQLEGGEIQGKNWLNKLEQKLTFDDIVSLKGQTMTIGAWAWADRSGESVRISITGIMEDGSYVQQAETIATDVEPIFYAYQVRMPENIKHSWITLTAEGYGTFYLDGIILTPGGFPVKQAPEPADIFNTSGVWGGEEYSNILRGASAESSWLRVRSWIDRLGSRILPDSGKPSMVIYSMLDKEAGGGYYAATFRNLQQTFWGRFGWGHIPLVVSQVYWIMGAVTIIGILGLIAGLTDNVHKVPWSVLIFLVMMMILVWGMAVVRGSFYLFSNPFIPSSRYAYPAIIPTIGMICLGWWKLGRWIRHILWSRFMKRIPVSAGLIGFWSIVAILNLVSLVTLFNYYYA